VFYCEPPHGGRIFFDPPLGKPWKLHPCTTSDRQAASEGLPRCERIEERETSLIFEDGTNVWIIVPLKISQRSDGTSRSIAFRKMNDEEMTLYFYDNSVVWKDFIDDINTNYAGKTSCFVVKNPDCLYYEIMFSKRGPDGSCPKERDTQTLTAYKNQNFPRRVSREDGLRK
jgi:hypothetical protein